MSKAKELKGEKNHKVKGLFEKQENVKYENSLEEGKYVYAKFRDGRMEIAKIVDCKPIKGHDSILNKDEFSYDYYVHYLLHNRRLDRYVNRSEIQYVIFYLIYY